jgi:hypothetical protein
MEQAHTSLLRLLSDVRIFIVMQRFEQIITPAKTTTI